MKDWDLQTLFDRGMLDDAIVRDDCSTTSPTASG